MTMQTHPGSLAEMWRAATRDPLVDPPAPPDAAPAVAARVNHGRWVVECPALGCGGAQIASRDDHRFWCVECRNYEHAGAWLPVAWPDARVVADAEKVLAERPLAAQRNWDPTVEDIAVLVGENILHGAR